MQTLVTHTFDFVFENDIVSETNAEFQKYNLEVVKIEERAEWPEVSVQGTKENMLNFARDYHDEEFASYEEFVEAFE